MGFPIFVSFFINMAVVSIAAVSVYQQVSDEVANTVGLTNICSFFKSLGAAGCILWGIALLAAGQSSAITTTYTGQYIMEGFLKMNIVNVALSILLPFALFPLAKYNCTPSLMGEEHAIKGWQKWAVYFLVILVYIVNAVTLS